MKNTDTFGINIKKYCRDHEADMLSHPSTPELLAEHEKKIQWLQHERLVHLIVTVMVVLVELFVVDLVLLHPEFGILPPILMLGLAVLLGFYFFHYFFLENTVQHWYKMAEKMKKNEKVSQDSNAQNASHSENTLRKKENPIK